MFQRLGPLLVVTALLAGCGADPQRDKTDSPPILADEGAVVAPDAGISITLPSGWTVVDKNSDALDGQFAAAAEMAGMSPEQFQQAIAGLDLYAQNATSSLTVVAIPDDTLPNEDFLRGLHEEEPIKVDGIVTVETPLGPGRKTVFHSEAPERRYAGETIYIVVDDHLAQITASTSQATESGAILAEVLDSLKPA